jgi:uncharacterized protein YceK
MTQRAGTSGRTLAAGLLTTLLLTGCTTVRHPHAPGLAYASLDACYAQHLDDAPGACTKLTDREATAQAIGVGAQVLLVLTYTGFLVLAIVGGR